MEKFNIEILKSIQFGRKVYYKGATLKDKQITAEILAEANRNTGTLRKVPISVGDPVSSKPVESTMTFKDESYKEETKEEETKTEIIAPSETKTKQRATRIAR